jgi:hypothetical protein
VAVHGCVPQHLNVYYGFNTMVKRLNYPLLHFLSCTLLGGVDLSRSTSLFLISRRGPFSAQPPSSPPPLPLPPPPLLLALLALLAAASLLLAQLTILASTSLLLASKSSASMARGGRHRSGSMTGKEQRPPGGEEPNSRQKLLVRLMRKREADRVRSTPPSNVQERK